MLTAALPAQPIKGKPGTFDFYLLTLSWSPQYCYSNPSAVECTGNNHYGFIVHGLWPEMSDGHYPQNCSTERGPANTDSVATIMPDQVLIGHEWTKHGTCSGLGPDGYFQMIAKVFRAITIPAEFQRPASSRNWKPSDIKQAFEQANPKISDGEIAVNCPQNALGGVQICLTKSGDPMKCPGNTVRDCRAGSIQVRPVR
jgi:ribonuclease T2